MIEVWGGGGGSWHNALRRKNVEGHLIKNKRQETGLLERSGWPCRLHSETWPA